MARTIHGQPARAGDEIAIPGHSVGESQRSAVILEVLGDPGHERFRVRWEDGHESILSPGDDAVIQRPEGAGRKTAAKSGGTLGTGVKRARGQAKARREVRGE